MDPWGISSYRNVQFEGAWEADLERLREGEAPPAAIDEVVSSLDWVLSRRGDDYPEVDGTPFRVIEIPPARGLPRLNAWFTLDDEMVRCHRLIEWPAAGEEDDILGS